MVSKGERARRTWPTESVLVGNESVKHTRSDLCVLGVLLLTGELPLSRCGRGRLGSEAVAFVVRETGGRDGSGEGVVWVGCLARWEGLESGGLVC